MSIVEIDGRKMFPIKEAAQVVSYSRDHLTRLAREGKVFATVIGRQWFVDLASLEAYVENSQIETEVRKKILSQERKQELDLRNITNQQKLFYFSQSKRLPIYAIFTAIVSLFFGLSIGTVIHSFVNYSTEETMSLTQLNHIFKTQMAKVESLLLPGAEQKANVVQNNHNQILNDINTNSINASAPTTDIRPMLDVSQGILLLPAIGASTTFSEVPVSAFFSDEVKVSKQSSGNYVIERMDANGQILVTELPYVIVPVQAEE